MGPRQRKLFHMNDESGSGSPLHHLLPSGTGRQRTSLRSAPLKAHGPRRGQWGTCLAWKRRGMMCSESLRWQIMRRDSSHSQSSRFLCSSTSGPLGNSSTGVTMAIDIHGISPLRSSGAVGAMLLNDPRPAILRSGIDDSRGQDPTPRKLGGQLDHKQPVLRPGFIHAELSSPVSPLSFGSMSVFPQTIFARALSARPPGRSVEYLRPDLVPRLSLLLSTPVPSVRSFAYRLIPSPLLISRANQ